MLVSELVSWEPDYDSLTKGEPRLSGLARICWEKW